MGAEFDPDWQRQPWHNLYQSTSLPLDCVQACVYVRRRRDCVSLSMRVCVCARVCACSSACPGHIVAKGVKLTKLWDISLTCISSYRHFCACVYSDLCVYLGETKSNTEERQIYFDRRLCQSFSETLSSLRIYTASLCQRQALSKFFYCRTCVFFFPGHDRYWTEIRFKSTNCAFSLQPEIITMFILAYMYDCSKPLQRSQPQAEGRITSSMLKPKMTGEWVDWLEAITLMSKDVLINHSPPLFWHHFFLFLFLVTYLLTIITQTKTSHLI